MAANKDGIATRKVKNLSQITSQDNSDRTVFVKWKYDEKAAHKKDSKKTKVNNPTDKFTCEWLYNVNNTWFSGSSSEIDIDSAIGGFYTSIYTYPENAVQIKVRVKPKSKTYKINNKSTENTKYFNGAWESKSKYVSSLVPDKPSTPSAELLENDKYKMKVYVDVSDSKTTDIKFEFQDASTGKAALSPQRVAVIAGQASVNVTVSAGINYRVRCCGINNTKGNLEGPYSDWTDGTEALPGEISAAPVAQATSLTSINVSWNKSSNASSYTLQYTLRSEFFTSAPDQVTEVSGILATNTELFNLEPDYSISDSGTYYFRVKGVNDAGESGWSSIGSGRVGAKPEAPTSWSSVSSASPGDIIYLYWTHNSVDGSRETVARLFFNIDGTESYVDVENKTRAPGSIPTPENEMYGEDTGTYRYEFDTKDYIDGTNIKWKVSTKGAYDAWSDPSIEREINVYAPPVLDMTFGANNNWYWDEFEFSADNNIYISIGEMDPLIDSTVSAFPFFIQLNAWPINQTPISYNVSIVANDTYEDVDEVGNVTRILQGDEVFSRYIASDEHSISVPIFPSDISLFDGMTYTVNATLAMDSGLSADASDSFLFDIEEPDNMDLDATPIYDSERIALSICPYCTDDQDEPIIGMLLAVYRRQADGSFVEIGSNLVSGEDTFVVDPHPTLGTAYYRITAMNKASGSIYYSDFDYPIPESSVVLQWAETYRTIDSDTLTEDELIDQPLTESMLKLPYNIDVQDGTSPDVAFVNYIGRKHPVSYYGTGLSQSGNWKCEIDAEDTETIAALRRLAAWMGDVYVREPSGLGYWAQVNPQFTLEHRKPTIPVTFAITRVEGGV